MQTDFAAAGIEAGEVFARQVAEAHQAGGLDAARFGEAADGFVYRRRKAEVINVQGDFFHGESAGWRNAQHLPARKLKTVTAAVTTNHSAW